MNTQPAPVSFNYGMKDPLERALYILQDGIIILNRKSEITYINKAAEEAVLRQTGKLPGVGNHYFDFVHPERIESTKRYVADALSNLTTKFQLCYPQLGVETWFELGYYPMPDDSGLVTHVCVRGKDITGQVQLEKKIESERKKLKNQIIKATLDGQEKQRSEIGRELHDNVNQVLTTVKLYNELALTEEYTNKKLLLRSVQQVNYCIEALRTLSKTLGSPKIEETDLKDSVKELVDEVNATRRIEAHFFTYGINKDKVSQDLMTTIYRIAQEQLTNVLKYANASRVDIMLVGTAETIALNIKDNGEGFDVNKKSKGVGITNMISRTEVLGGHIEIESQPGKGCSLMVEFPL